VAAVVKKESPRPPPVVTAPAAPTASAAPKAPVNCNPPYIIDAAGVRKPKKECL
jgi:hypothetical protein